MRSVRHGGARPQKIEPLRTTHTLGVGRASQRIFPGVERCFLNCHPVDAHGIFDAGWMCLFVGKHTPHDLQIETFRAAA